ncbi:MAG: hypothetical protein ACK5Y2_09605 [Bdellovibrionales bacterium]
MQIIRGANQFKEYLRSNDWSAGCLADTGFLYAASYADDRVYQQAIQAFDLLEEFDVPIYANVISRMEFVDLIFRKQLTLGALQTFKDMKSNSIHAELFNFLKKVRDDDTSHKRNKQSFKIGEKRLKKLRQKLEQALGPTGWKRFCATCAGSMLKNEWQIMEEEFGLHFVEVLEGQTSDIIVQPLRWIDMVNTMGDMGIRGPDAMILNLFISSNLPVLITADKDYEFEDSDDPATQGKTILILEEMSDLVGELSLVESDDP